MRHKKFTYLATASLMFFVALNFAIWKLVTEDMLTGRVGDLSRLGYISGIGVLKDTVVDLERRHIEGADFRGGAIDMLVIGDSFSNGGSGGKNPFYQDYIATINGYTVVNIQPYAEYTPLTTIHILLNSGWLDKHRPRAVLVESVERYSVINLAGVVGVNRTDYIGNVERFYAGAEYTGKFKPGELTFINTGNMKFLANSLLYLFSDHAFFSPVYKRKLTAPLFSTGGGKELLFFHEDIDSIPMARSDYIARMNYNLNTLAMALGTRGIALVFMPAVDKYDLYSDYIVGNPYPKNPFFDLLRLMEKRYLFIDTKAILTEELKRGEKDIFAPDDTHWSSKASKKIFETVRFTDIFN